MRWEIIPDKFFLGAGGSIYFFIVKIETDDRKWYINNVIDSDQDASITEVKYEPAGTALSLSATNKISQNLELQATLGVNSGNSINVFEPSARMPPQNGGFFGFTNILLTLKF